MKPTCRLTLSLPFKDSIRQGKVDDIRARQLVSVEQIQNALELVHNDVKGFVTKHRQQYIKAHNRKNNIQPVDVSNGDFIRVRTVEKEGHRLGFTSRGPRRVVNTLNPLVYEVENFKTESREKVHAKRLRKVQKWILSWSLTQSTQMQCIRMSRNSVKTERKVPNSNCSLNGESCRMNKRLVLPSDSRKLFIRVYKEIYVYCVF